MARDRNFITANNHTWAYLKYGKGQPILILHGINNYADYLVPLGNLLASDFEVIIPDLPGCGFTARLKEKNSYQNVSKELLNFVKALGIEKFSLFGFSLGGAISLEMALNYPESIENLIVQSPPWRSKSIHLDLLGKIQLKLASSPKIIEAVQKNPELLKKIIMQARRVKTDADKLLNGYGSEIAEAVSLIDVRASKEFYDSLRKADFGKEINRINDKMAERTLLIAPENDSLIPITEIIDLSRILKNSAMVVVYDQDHEIILEAPEIMARILRDSILFRKSTESSDLHWWRPIRSESKLYDLN